jgi:hypothetical protein
MYGIFDGSSGEEACGAGDGAGGRELAAKVASKPKAAAVAKQCIRESCIAFPPLARL